MPNMDGTGPFGNGRPGRGQGPCRRRHDNTSRPDAANGQIDQGTGQRLRNNRKPGLSGMRNRFGGRNRGAGQAG